MPRVVGLVALQMARELDDAILGMRTNELELGLWIMNGRGNPENRAGNGRSFFWITKTTGSVREVLGMMRRTFARLDVSSRSIYALVEPGSCFVGTLFELALAADRIYVLDAQEE